MPPLNDELRAFLADRRYATVATNDANGGIHLTPVWFLFEDDRFLFESFSGSGKVRNLERNPRRSWPTRASPETNVGCPLRDGRHSSRVRRRRRRTQGAGSVTGPVFAAADDVTLRLTPKRWQSWAARDLDQQYFGRILGQTPERWFLPLEP